jgi:O-antigen/teichoic acid export membrane protein
MKSDLDRIQKAFKVLLSGTLILSFMGVVNTLMIAKDIGSELFGVFAILTSYSLIIDKLVNFQSWQGFIKYSTGYINDTNDIIDIDGIHRVTNSCFILDLITALLGFIIGIMLLPYLISYFSWDEVIDLDVRALYFFMFSMLFKFSSFSLGIFRIFDRHNLQIKSNFYAILIRSIVISTLYFYDSKIEYYLVTWAITESLLNLTLTINALKYLNKKSGRAFSFRNGLVKNNNLYKFVAWTNLSSIIDLPAKELDVMLVGILTNDKEAGFYKLAKQCMTLIGRLASPLYQVVYPIQVKYINNGDYKLALILSGKISKQIAIAAPIIITISYLFGPELIDKYMGETYIGLGMIAVIAIGVKSLDVIFTTYHSLFIAFGYVKLNAFILVIANIIMLIMFFLLVPTGGSEYALYCLASQAIITFVLKYTYIKWKLNER